MNLSSVLWSVIALDGELIIDWQDGSRRETSWFPAHHEHRFTSMLDYHREQGNDPRVSLVPRRDRHLDAVGPSQVFWAAIDNPVGARSLEAFKPTPTVVLRHGRRSVALWWLDRPLPVVADLEQDWLIRGNRRLAYAIKANSARTSPELLLPVGKLELAHADPSLLYKPADVVGRLADAPVRRLRPV